MPKLPRHGAYLWEYFAHEVTGLHATRQSAGMGPARLSRAEIHAWERDEGVTLERWERRALMAIDQAWLKSISEDLAERK